jgi:hypothetical protein
METWKLLAAVPPLVVWISLFLYMNKVEARLKSLEKEHGR